MEGLIEISDLLFLWLKDAFDMNLKGFNHIMDNKSLWRFYESMSILSK